MKTGQENKNHIKDLSSAIYCGEYRRMVFFIITFVLV